jgi:hypothetical protein
MGDNFNEDFDSDILDDIDTNIDDIFDDGLDLTNIINDDDNDDPFQMYVHNINILKKWLDRTEWVKNDFENLRKNKGKKKMGGGGDDDDDDDDDTNVNKIFNMNEMELENQPKDNRSQIALSMIPRDQTVVGYRVTQKVCAIDGHM